MLNTKAVRTQFPAFDGDRVILDATASTQIPRPLMEYKAKASDLYANVHRGKYRASDITTLAYEAGFTIAANLINARSIKEIVMGQGTTDLINGVKNSLRPEFRDGDNIVTTALEHNANYVSWKKGLIPELAQYGRNIELRIVDFDPKTGELDMSQLTDLVDERTKLLAVTGASNFMGIKTDVTELARIAHQGGYTQPNGRDGAYILIDGAQLVPSTFVDVQASDLDFLVWSYHKMSSAQGLGGLFIRQEIGETLEPFAYGGDHVNDVSREEITFKGLPWKFMTGTPNILETIGSGFGTSFLINAGLGHLFDGSESADEQIDLRGRQILTNILMYSARGDDPKIQFSEIPYNSTTADEDACFEFLESNSDIAERMHDPVERLKLTQEYVRNAMNNITLHEEEIMQPALTQLSSIQGLNIYGPLDARLRSPLIAMNIEGLDPHDISRELNKEKYGNIESRSGNHCASIAHNDLGIESTFRISGYIYTDESDISTAINAIEAISRRAR